MSVKKRCQVVLTKLQYVTSWEWERVGQNNSLWNVLLYDVIVWISSTSAEEDGHLCLSRPAHRFTHTVFTREIPMLGKSEWTLFLMKNQTASVRNLSFVHFILPWIRLQTRHNLTWIFKKIETKRQCCADYIGSDVAPHKCE